MPEKTKHINLRSEEVQEILTKVPHGMIRYGNVLFLGLIVLLLFLSWLIKYPDIVTARATLTTKIPPQKVYAKSSRQIDSIFVNQSDKVVSGQTLAVLENTANYDDVIYLKRVLGTIGLTKSGFYFPLDKMPLMLLGDIEASYAVFENAYLVYILNRRLNPYKSEKRAVVIIQHELENKLKNLKNQIDFKTAELGFERKKLERSEQLYHKGVISTQEHEQAQMEYLGAQRDLKNLKSSLFQLQQSLAENRKSSRGVFINKTTDKKTLLRKVIQSFHQLKMSIRHWEFQYVLQAEIKGKVYFFNHWSKHQTVQQGDLVFTVIPAKNSPYIAKLKTPIQNSGKIKVGQKVLIKLQNYPEQEFGLLTGRVKNISKIPEIEDDQRFYTVNVAMPDKLVTSYGKEIDFKGEMFGSAEIITQDVRLIERFFYQLKDALKR